MGVEGVEGVEGVDDAERGVCAVVLLGGVGAGEGVFFSGLSNSNMSRRICSNSLKTGFCAEPPSFSGKCDTDGGDGK